MKNILFTSGSHASGLHLLEGVEMAADAPESVTVNPLLGASNKQFKAIVKKSYKDFERFFADDFTKIKDKRFDYVMMNPPFKNGEWRKHLNHALNICNKGVYCVMPLLADPRYEHRVINAKVSFERTDLAGKVIYVEKTANRIKLQKVAINGITVETVMSKDVKPDSTFICIANHRVESVLEMNQIKSTYDSKGYSTLIYGNKEILQKLINTDFINKIYNEKVKLQELSGREFGVSRQFIIQTLNLYTKDLND